MSLRFPHFCAATASLASLTVAPSALAQTDQNPWTGFCLWRPTSLVEFSPTSLTAD
jgi:hypothetical protein